MKILGIDYGEKRIGLAVSDETLTFAREVGIMAPKQFWLEIRGFLKDNGIGKIVLGWPLNMDGGETKKTQEISYFKLKILKETGLPVETTDERLSSVMARNLPGGKVKTDSLAAQILLQNYLDKTKMADKKITNNL